MKYDDFVLRITTEGEQPWVRVIRSPAGEGEAPFHLPEDHPKILRLPDRYNLWSQERLESLGRRLFEVLFPEPIRQLLDQSLARLEPPQGLCLRLLLDPEPSPLHEIPWELLYHPEAEGFLVLSRRTPLVRTLNLPTWTRPREKRPRLRILVVISQPIDVGLLDLSGEVRTITDVLRGHRDASVTFLRNPDLQTFRSLLIERPFDVLHFSGMGVPDRVTGESAIVLTNPDGSALRVMGHELAGNLRDVPSLRLVILNADETVGVAMALVRAGLPAVVAMQSSVEDQMALLFSGAFYRRLQVGDSLEAALAEARLALRMSAPDSTAWAQPVLIERSAIAASAEQTSGEAKGQPTLALREAFEAWLAAARSRLGRLGNTRVSAEPSARPASARRFDLLPAWLGVALGLAVGGGAAVALLQGPTVVAVSGFVLLLGLAAWMVGSAQPVEAAEVALPLPAAPAKTATEPVPAESSPADRAWQTPELVRDRQLVPLPGGVFEMGSPEAEDGHLPDESPLHEVRVSAFACMRYPVTRRLYEAVVGEDPDWPEGEADDRPVNNVSWEDAVHFCNRWSKREGLTSYYEIREDIIVERRGAGGYRLPTEAEWEYACRAGTRTRWSFGDEESVLDRHAWYVDNSERKPQPVGRKEPNRWGLYDLHGNVWEWVEDLYGPYNAEPQEDPTGPAEGKRRVLRGGSCIDVPRLLRSALRLGLGPTFRGGGIGFRCVRASGREPSPAPRPQRLPAWRRTW